MFISSSPEAVAVELERRGLDVGGLHRRAMSLEDAFIGLTGKY